MEAALLVLDDTEAENAVAETTIQTATESEPASASTPRIRETVAWVRLEETARPAATSAALDLAPVRASDARGGQRSASGLDHEELAQRLESMRQAAARRGLERLRQVLGIDDDHHHHHGDDDHHHHGDDHGGERENC